MPGNTSIVHTTWWPPTSIWTRTSKRSGYAKVCFSANWMVIPPGPVLPVACLLVAVFPPILFHLFPVAGRSPCYSLLVSILLLSRRNNVWQYSAPVDKNTRAPFRLSCCSNGQHQNFLPTREPALGESFLAHPPAARPSLDSEDQRLSPKDAVDGIDDYIG